MKLSKAPKMNIGTLVLAIIVLSLVAYNRGYQAAIILLYFSLAVVLNGWATMEVIGWVRSRIRPVKLFWFLLPIVVLIDALAVYLDYGPHVVIIGIFLPVAFAVVLLIDDWLRAKWESLISNSRKR